MFDVLGHNPGLAISLGLLAGGGVMCLLLAALMSRGGSSLKGVAFFGVFYALVVLPQVAFHLAQATRPVALSADPASPAATAGAISGAAPAPGPGPVDGSRVRRFDTPAQASEALLAYLVQHGVAPTLDRGGDEVEGTASGRGGTGDGAGVGGVVRLKRSGALLGVVTAPDEGTLRARVAALPPGWPGPPPAADPVAVATVAVAAPTGVPLVPALQPVVRWFDASVLLQIAGVLVMLIATVGWFFAGSAWAARVSRVAGAEPLLASDLRQRLLDVDRTDAPVTVEQRPDGRLAVTWRHADARWLDLAGAHRLRRTHRLLLRLDEAARRVRVTEQFSAFDASVGARGAALRWHTGMGMAFFQVERQRVFGLQFGRDGRPTGDLTYAWRFDLNELKSPFIDAVTGAGWDWQPVVLDLPALQDRT